MFYGKKIILFMLCNKSLLSLQAAPPSHHPRGQRLHQKNDRLVEKHTVPQRTERPETGIQLSVTAFDLKINALA